MGLACRSGQVLNLKLTSFFYKQLSNETLTEFDIEAIDKYAVQAIDTLKKMKSVKEAEGEFVPTWTTTLSNGEEVPLMDMGATKRVEPHEIQKYIERCLEVRLKEGERQMRAIRRGFNDVFPIKVLSILTPEEIDEMVNGPAIIEVEYLKRVTKVRGGEPDSDFLKHFWAAFETFTEA